MSDSETQTYVLQTAGFDARFPNTNQSRHCFQAYVDYFRCVNAKGEDFPACKTFWRTYHSLCPSAFSDCASFPSPLASRTQDEGEAASRANALTIFDLFLSLGSGVKQTSGYVTSSSSPSMPSDSLIAKWDEQREENRFPAKLD
ncbi:Cytochrome c oxidase subunit 6B [Rhodotorula toruloides]